MAGYEGFIPDINWNISDIPFKCKLRDYYIRSFKLEFTMSFLAYEQFTYEKSSKH